MIRMSTARLIAATPLIALLAACGGETASDGADDMAAAPSGDAPAEIKERQDNFEAIGDSFKVIRTQLEGEPDFAAIQAAAADISERAQAIEGHFPEGSGRDAGWDTEALPSIWEKPAEFAAAHERLIEKSGDMVAAAATSDAATIGAQVGELGGSCKNCHDTFRLDDD